MEDVVQNILLRQYPSKKANLFMKILYGKASMQRKIEKLTEEFLIKISYLKKADCMCISQLYNSPSLGTSKFQVLCMSLH